MQTLIFYRNKRAALYANYLAASAPSAPSVVRSVSSQTDVSPAQRKRMERVNDALQRGANPYEKDATDYTPDAGGIEQNRKESAERKRIEQESAKADALYTERAASWKAKSLRPVQVRVNVDLRTEIKPMAPWPQVDTPNGTVDDPDLRRCSFCYGFAHFSVVTVGVSGLQKVNLGIDEVVIQQGDLIWLQAKIAHTTRPLIACPDCCDKLSPVREVEPRKQRSWPYVGDGK